MKREKKLTKRERKAAKPKPGASGGHIHCIACGRHIDPEEFDDPVTALVITCQHQSTFPCCVACEPTARQLLEEHDRSGQPVRYASAWH